MQRRSFIKQTSLTAMAVSSFGFIHFDGNKYVGDCETTSDILGPYYRPDSPIRNNLVIPGDKGAPVTLQGKIKHQDCTTPYKNARIELWHCDGNGVYDNSTADFKYRGTTFSDDLGNYSFNTILPVAYDAGGGEIRPAHFHLMITAEGYLPLVTQLYFNGDKHIAKDPYANADAAKKRRLDIVTTGNSRKVTYDVSMSKTIAAEPASLDKLTGKYVDKSHPDHQLEFFIKNNSLWLKNEVFGEEFRYIGKNTFEYSGMPKGSYENYVFEILGSGEIKCTSNYFFDVNHKGTTIYWK